MSEAIQEIKKTSNDYNHLGRAGENIPQHANYSHVQVAAAVCDVEPAFVYSARQTRSACLARYIAARLMRDDGFSKSEIGRTLGRDHTTVIAGLGRLTALVKRNKYDALAKLEVARNIMKRKEEQ